MDRFGIVLHNTRCTLHNFYNRGPMAYLIQMPQMAQFTPPKVLKALAKRVVKLATYQGWKELNLGVDNMDQLYRGPERTSYIAQY